MIIHTSILTPDRHASCDESRLSPPSADLYLESVSSHLAPPQHLSEGLNEDDMRHPAYSELTRPPRTALGKQAGPAWRAKEWKAARGRDGVAGEAA